MGNPGLFLGVERSATGQSWRRRNSDERLAAAISQTYDLPDILGRVLAARDVRLEDVEEFMSPTLRSLMPPAREMRDLDKGAERICAAVRSGEKIGIIGDYDVDGICSSALFRLSLRQYGVEPLIHIPHRLDEGYGPNPGTLDRFKAEGVTLAITVDCGVGAHEPLSHAQALGIDVVVIDHHQANADLPHAHAIINPNRRDDLSGQGQLCAAGVCFVVLASVNAMLRNGGDDIAGKAEKVDLLGLLDLAALATVCDVVPLTGLNRALVRQGLAVLTRRNNPGLAVLADAAGLRRRPDVHAAGFVIGPRINASGRLGHAEIALELMTTQDRSRLGPLAQELEKLNKERQQIELDILDNAMHQAERAIGRQEQLPAIVVTGDGWHAGVLGLVAGRLRERFGRPAIAIGFEADGTGQGSGRSIPGVDLGSAIRDAVQLGHLAKGGGHAMAAGLTLERERLGPFRAFLEEQLAADTEKAVSAASVRIDAALTASGATIDLIEMLERAGPFGVGNPTPRFVFPSHRIAFADLVGQEHIRCSLAGGDGGRLSAIAFRALGSPLGELLLESQGTPLHVAGRLSINDWGGKRSAQLMIDDVAQVQ